MRWQTLYEGRWVFGILLLLGVAFSWFFPWALVPVLLLLLFSLWFFRDPERAIPEAEDAIVSPADGLVTDVEEMDDLPQGGTGWRISIFLSVFSVHVNRAPVAGKVESSQYKPGNFLDARHPDSATKNESQTWFFSVNGRADTVVVRQITGAIARRIVPWSQVGDHVSKGHRFGMIRFGSRTDLFLPASAVPTVKAGESVEGGASVLARWIP
jgi:phosphatidylserine decarboxylase